MSNNSYFRIRAVLSGHEKDVRCLSSGSGLSDDLANSIISGSRDLTIRLWKPNDFDVSFLEQFCAGGHSGFIASLAVVPASTQGYENGAIVSGSGDGTILVHSLNSPEPAVRIPNAHENTVSSIYTGTSGFMVSGSWDTTAKVWMNFKPVMTLKGHEAAVWAVLGIQSSGIIVTASADKTIRIWSAGQCRNVLQGHTDCVRGLATLPPVGDCSEMTLLSCSNDTTIRRWNLSGGACISIYNGHSDFVYSIVCGISPLTQSPFFVTSGEDRTMRVWNPTSTTAVQTVPHPAQSVWCVCILRDGDIVTGSSDGVVRVFTVAPERVGSAEVLADFEKAVAQIAIPAQTFGGIKFADLPGPDVLMFEGKRDGQTVMVRFGDDEKDARVECHMWSAADQRWNLVGTVVGQADDTAPTSAGKKAMYKGKEYDYVFDVDIDERVLKLPYNAIDNPWLAAHNFLEENELDQLFLDQVANFIMKNAKAVTIGGEWHGNVDPFTGGSSYHTGGAMDTSNGHKNGADAAVKYYPEKNYVLFDTAPNIAGLRAKLLEFDGLHAPHSVGGDVLNCLVDSVASLSSSSEAMLKEENVALLGELVSWPDSHLVPVLDLVRVVAKSEDVVAHLFKIPRFLPSLLKQLMPEKPTANQFLVLRTLANVFGSSPGRMIMLSNSAKILSSLEALIDSNNKNVQNAVATVLLNYSVVGYNEKLAEAKMYETVVNVIKFILERGVPAVDCEAVFRLIVAVGTLASIGQVAITDATKSCLPPLKPIAKDVPQEEKRIRDTIKSLSLLLAAS